MSSISAEFESAIKAVTHITEKLKTISGVDERVCVLKEELGAIGVLVHSVEANPDLASQLDLLHFVNSLRKLAFHGQDVVEIFYLEVASKIHRKNTLLRYTWLTAHYNRVAGLIKQTDRTLQRLQDARERFKNYKIPDGIASSSQVTPPAQGNYILHDNQVPVGIDGVILHLAESLVNPDSDFKVLGIVGVVGGGKTLLARNLYRHSQVARWFTYRAFVSVSQQRDGATLLREVYMQIVKHGKDVNARTERQIRQELEGILRHSRCLIVLDNICHKEDWDVVGSLLTQSMGSRFILTTGNQQVVLYADNKCIIHKPELLTKEQKWELFSKIAMEGRPGIENDATFKELGEQMLKNRQGLPLEVVTLARIAKTKAEVFEWENLSKASDEYILPDVWKLFDWSHSHLSTHLQKLILCLAAGGGNCGHFDAQMTIKFWIAENLIPNYQQTGEDITVEDSAMLALNELALCSRIEVSSRSVRGHIEQFRIHDFMLQSFIRKAKQEQFLEKIPSATPNGQPRRIALSSSFCSEYWPENNLGLQAIVLHNESNGPGVHNPNGARELFKLIVKTCKLLKVLIICGEECVALPKEIGKFRLLKYLHIDAKSNLNLPKSTRKLINLLYVELHSPEGLGMKNLSGIFYKMPDLRGIVLPHLTGRSIKSLGLSGCKKLQSLKSGAGTWMTKDLPTLSPTIKSLEISDIKEVEEIEAIYQCPGITEGGICKLKCDYSVSDLEFDLQKLWQCKALWSLELSGLLRNRERAIQFPLNLEELCLSGSRIEDCSHLMEVLGRLPKLKSLSLSNGSYLGTQLSCTGGAFPHLQELHFKCLANLEGWTMEEGAMARLEKMEIEGCLSLKRLPESIRFISTLKELNLGCMSEEFFQRLGDGGQDSNIIQHIPSVNFTSARL